MKIPQYLSRESANTRPLPAAETGIVDVSGLTSGLVRGAERIDAAYERQQREQQAKIEREAERAQANEAALSVAKADADLTMWSTDALTKARATAPAGAAGMTTELMKSFDDYTASQTEGLTERAKSAFQVRVQAHKSNFFQNAAASETTLRNQNLELTFDGAVDSASQAAYLAPESAVPGIANLQASVHQMDLPVPVKSKMLLKAREVAVSAATRLAELDPQGTLAVIGGGNTQFEITRTPPAQLVKLLEAQLQDPEIDAVTRVDVKREIDRIKAGGQKTTARERVAGNPVFDLLNPQQLDAIAKHAMTQVSRLDQQARTSLEANERDVQAIAQTGGSVPSGMVPTPGQYIRAFGVDGVRRYQTEIVPYLQLAAGVSELKDASYEQRQKIVADSVPKPGPGFAEDAKVSSILTQANKNVEARIAADPAAYAAQSPIVQRAAAVMAADPGNPIAVNAYAEATVAEQERLGVRQIRIDADGQARKNPVPRLLTNAQVNGIVQQFHDAKPEGAANVVQSLEQQWGKHWPAVYGQLAADGKLTPAALVIPNMQDQGSKSRLAAASAVKDDDLKAMLGPNDPRDLRAALQNSFQTAAATFLAQGIAGGQTLNTFMGQAEKLGLWYMSQGKPAAKAAEQAYTEVMGWRYSFKSTYRVPKDQQPDSVDEGAQWAMRTMTGVEPFASNIAGLTPEALKEQTLDAVRRNGFWQTNGDESGLRLMVQGQDGTAYPVTNERGRAVEWSWEQLRRAGEESRKARQLRRGGRVGEVQGAR